MTAPPVRVRQALALNFYTKHVDVDGFSVVASDNVSDYALLEAAYLIRKNARSSEGYPAGHGSQQGAICNHGAQRIHDAYSEHRDLQPRFRNRRARLGATPERPAVSCGEENHWPRQ